MIKIARNLLLSTIAGVVVASASAMAVSAQDGSGAPLSDYAAASDPPAFDTPDQAVDAFKSAVASGDFDKLANLVGLDAAKAKASDGVMDAYADIQAGVKKKVTVEDVENRKVLEIGDVLWPFPFPIAKGDDGKWAFDTYTGLEEIANRLVGSNELDTIATVRAYVEAQEEYALADHDGDGVLEYAQKLISSEGKTDGLYWPATEGEPQSPAGEALADGAVLARAQAGKGYFGYRYRVLTSQGDNIAGGKFDYIINGNMIAGFGLVAWPVKYGVTGVHSFVVNRNGTVYQADLGDKTESVASGIRQFNPNDNWQVVED
ncbi:MULTISPECIES: DUF2950 domain-containing protein [unclassified Ensifer]|uniref:DUF2950 domain-containing protein n=1 Tax=unclassified Ensifer TaxID=2633371 RepID=UPI0008137533|nr:MULTISPECIES: DUF2950 domain-containing protein [unclassified Ensifer]OCO98239.1 hypothetical protein BC374_11250 [Ensifer sp. LC13]OCP05120.1 hypothetical protein BC362_15335 [Ensifer sp. LC14]OCP14472.1 hypothetical protein BBX50_11525 [Ensifer sp. LC11]OCP29132.1 hypothetical protein BC364_09650 [Ensifer sp. LC499]